jgi:hypothetical protein
MTRLSRTIRITIILLAALVIIGSLAPAPVALKESKCACATELEALKKYVETRFAILGNTHAVLHTEHYSICKAKHGIKDHEIRPRRNP